MKSNTRLSLIVLSLGLVIASGGGYRIALLDQPLSRPPALQVDGEGRAFVAAGRQLLRLNRELVPEQNVTLTAGAVNISLSSGGERLVVCTDDSSCVVYNASDLSAPLSVHPSALTGVVNRVALFTAGDSFYVGSFDPTNVHSTRRGTIRLSQIGGLEGASDFVRSIDYDAINHKFQRDFFGGFMSGANAYYIAIDPKHELKMMRVCHVGSCPDGNAMCPVAAVYEETIASCGKSVAREEDTLCGLSVVEDFAEIPGTSILISRCQMKSAINNVVCLIPVAEVDRIMDVLFRSVPFCSVL